MRQRSNNSFVLLFDWLTKRGPGVIFLRLMAQFIRIVIGRPIYHYSRITPQLYIGGQHRKRGWGSMQVEGITAIVNLRREYDDAKKHIIPNRYLHLPTTDNTAPSLHDLEQGVEFITDEIEKNGKVYVHCGVGVGRAPTLAAAYLVSTGKTPAEAWQHIRKVRPFIWPTSGQMRQVERYAQEIKRNK